MEMEQVMYQLIMYLNCIFEIYLLYNFLEALFPLYEDRKWVLRLEAFGCITTIFVINHLRMPLMNVLCVPFIYLLFVWMVFRIELKLNLPYAVFYYLILAISEFAFMHIYPFIGVDASKADFVRITLLIIQSILRFMVIQVVKQMHHIPYESGSYKYTKSLYMLPVATMILLNGFIIPIKHPYGNFLISLGSILLILSSITNFSVVEKLLHAQNIIKDNEMVILKTKLEKKHYQRMEEIYEEYAGYMHDMRHILKTVNCLAQTENNQKIKKLSQELTEFWKTKSPLERKKYIDDPITNAIFMEREKVAIEKGLCFKVNIQKGIDIGFISELDKIRIIGNLLDNAIEAAMQCEDGYLSIDLCQRNESIVLFRVENNFKHKNKKKENSYLSIKDDGIRHGFGLRNVKELLEKYNGMLKITEEGNAFIILIAFSNMQKTGKS